MAPSERTEILHKIEVNECGCCNKEIYLLIIEEQEWQQNVPWEGMYKK